MSQLFTRAAFVIIGIAVVWLMIKMSRSDAADMRLAALGLAGGAAVLAVFAGLGAHRRRRRHSAD